MRLTGLAEIWSCLLLSPLLMAFVEGIQVSPRLALTRETFLTSLDVLGDGYYYKLHDASQQQPSSVPGKNFRIDKNNQIVLNSDKNIDFLLLTDLIIATQVDGYISGINRNSGKVIWSTYLGSPLLKSITDSPQHQIQRQPLDATNNTFSFENSESSSDSGTKKENADSINTFHEFWAVEPFNKGSLYFFTKETGLSKVPLSLNDLIMASPFSVDDDDKIFTGSRNTKMIHLDLLTGEILNDSNVDIANVVSSSSKTSSSTRPSATVSIGITEYHLSISSKSDSTRWSISYMELSENNIYNDLKLQNFEKIRDVTISPFQKNKLLAIDSETYSPKWLADLNATCINVFDIFYENESAKQMEFSGNKSDVEVHDKFFLVSHPMRRKNISSNSLLQNPSAFLATVGNGTWYVMSGQNYPSLVKSSRISKFEAISKDSKLTDNFTGLSESEFVKLITGVHRDHSVTNKSKDNGSGHDLVVDKNRNQNENSSATIIKESTCLSPGNDNFKRDLITLDKNNKLIQSDTIAPSSEQFFPSLSHHPHHSRYSVGYIFVRFIENTIFTGLSVLAVYLAFRYELIPLKVLLARSNSSNNVKTIKSEIQEEKPNISEITNDSTAIFETQLITDEDMNEEKNSYSKEVNLITSCNTANDIADDIAGDILKKPINTEAIGEIVTEVYSSDDSETKNFSIPAKEILEDLDLKQLDGATVAESNSPLLGNMDDSASHNEETVISEEDVKIKKKRKRGCRGGKNKKKNSKNVIHSTEVNDNLINIKNSTIDTNIGQDEPNDNFVDIIIKQPLKYSEEEELGKSKLIITDQILGYGSHGTIVYRGTFENRPVAVKRMLIDFYDVASHEVSLLQESDDHPNVVRYFCSRQSDRFLYIALELCEANLENMLMKNNKLGYFKTSGEMSSLKFENIQNMLYQMALGLQYLHRLSIVHRDIKPQNILITKSKTDELRVLISDFGLCKKLDPDQSSFKASTLTAASGTTGWKAPELLLLLLNMGSNDNVSTSNKISKMIDVYSLGLVFYYMLTNGKHPFGDKFNREANILQDKFELDDCLSFEAKDMITGMIKFDSRERLSIELILKHPFFWNKDKKIELLLKISDKLNILDRESEIIKIFEKNSHQVFKFNDWSKNKFNDNFLSNLNSFRKYDYGKLMDLLRVFRNKYHHVNEIPKEFKINENNFLDFFINLYPNLLMYNYYFVRKYFKEDLEQFF